MLAHHESPQTPKSGNLELTDPLLLAQAQQLDGRLHVSMVQPSLAPALFLAAARQFLPLDGDRARHSMLEAFDAFLKCHYFTRGTDGAEIAKAALTTRPIDFDGEPRGPAPRRNIPPARNRICGIRRHTPPSSPAPAGRTHIGRGHHPVDQPTAWSSLTSSGTTEPISHGWSRSRVLRENGAPSLRSR